MNTGEIILNQYRIDKKLGQGGFGEVYQARHLSWNIDLAIKVPKPEIVARTGGIKAFEQEAETWVNLGLHPHTVSCYYVRRLDNNPLVFAEYVAGGSLHDWIRGRKLYKGGKEASLEKILDIAIQFAWGLDFAHEKGLIHQDVKPENVMMTPGGVVKVTDFGLAKGWVLMDAVKTLADGTVVTEAGAMTPAYCSPEQANKQTLTRRTDLWSWAVSVLEMFVGERTWPSGSIAGYSLENYLRQEPEDSTFPQMPTKVAELLSHCFQENPSERPRTMVDVASQLQEIYQQVTGTVYPRTVSRAAEDIADSLNNRAVSLLDLGKQEEVMQLWKKALQVQPQHPESTYNQGLVLWRRGEIDDLALLRRLKENHQDDWQGDYWISLVHLERDDCEKAIEILEDIVEGGKRQDDFQKALVLAKEKLPNSSRLLRIFEAHAASFVYSVCLSADGHFALSGSSDGTLKLWSIETGKCLHTFAGHSSVYSVCLSADGRFALSGSRGKTLKLWSVETGDCIRTFAGHGSVYSVCLSADGHFALSGSDDGTLKLWSIETGKCLHTFAGHTDSVTSVCLSADGGFALSGSDDGTLKLWSIETGKCLHTFAGHTDSVTSVCLSADGGFTLSGSDDGTLKLWSIETGKCLRTFATHAPVKSVYLSANGRLALSGSIDGTLKLWSVGFWSNNYLAPIKLSQIVATEKAFSIDFVYRQELTLAQKAIAQKDYETAVKHLREARSQTEYSYRDEIFSIWASLYIHLPCKTFINGWENKSFGNSCGFVCLSADGRFALSGSDDKTPKLWSVETGDCLHTFAGHADSVTSVCLSADGRFALSGSSDKTLKLWSVETGDCLRTFAGHTDSVTSVCLSADGRFALSGSCHSDKTLKLWSVETGDCLRTFEEQKVNYVNFVYMQRVKSVCLSADGRFALSGSTDGTLKLWSIETGGCTHTFEGHAAYASKTHVNSVCLNADGRFALSGSDDGTLKLWSIETGKCLRTFAGHTDSVTSVCLSANGGFALSGSDDGTLKLWSIETGKCLRTFAGHADSVTSVCLSADGRFALSGSSDKTLKLWFLDWDLELKQPADWDEGARPYLDIFIQQQTPYAAPLPTDGEPTEEEITLALTRRGIPTWTESDFQNLLYTLGCAGYGWLRPEGVRQQLEAMATSR